jgi:heat shock protein HslJ
VRHIAALRPGSPTGGDARTPSGYPEVASAGCNDGGGGWELDGHDLTIGTLVHTMKACSDPEGVMEQETAIYEALGSAARVEIAPGSLTILDDDGHIALTATS